MTDGVNQHAHSALLLTSCASYLPSVPWHCWLGDRKSIWPVNNLVVCMEQDANDLHMVQLMPLLLHHLCFSKIQNGSSFWYRLTWVVPDKGPYIACSLFPYMLSFKPPSLHYFIVTCSVSWELAMHDSSFVMFAMSVVVTECTASCCWISQHRKCPAEP